MAFSQPIAAMNRIRGPKLAVFATNANGVPMVEALSSTADAGLVIPPSTRLDKALTKNDKCEGITAVFSCWSGTIVGYDKPDAKLGKKMISTDPETGTRYIFPVPEEHRGKKNVLLVAEPLDFILVKDRNDWIVQATEVGSVEQFPTDRDGWFPADSKHGIPHGAKGYGLNRDLTCLRSSSDDYRYLLRSDEYVGLIVRGYGCYSYYYGRYVVLNQSPSYALGVAVEPNESVSSKKQ